MKANIKEKVSAMNMGMFDRMIGNFSVLKTLTKKNC